MKTFLANAAAIGLVLVATGFVAAGGPNGHGGNHGGQTTMKNSMHYNSMHDYRHGNYGHKFSHGTWYPKDYFYWNYRCYSAKYGCDVYWCPTESCYYYYSPTAYCYYPVTYIVYAPPVVTTQVVTTVAPAAVQTIAAAAMTKPANIPPAP